MTCEVTGCSKPCLDDKRVCTWHWIHLPFEMRPGWTESCPDTNESWEDVIIYLEMEVDGC